jgi:hypothetical protein
MPGSVPSGTLCIRYVEIVEKFTSVENGYKIIYLGIALLFSAAEKGYSFIYLLRNVKNVHFSGQWILIYSLINGNKFILVGYKHKIT